MKMNSKGFTLIETVMATSLTTMVTLGLMTLLISSLQGWSRGVSRNTSTESASVAVQRFCNDVRDGKSASVSGGVLTVVFPGKIVDLTTGETMYDLSSATSTSRSYLLSSAKLVRRTNELYVTIAKNIDSVTFSVQGGTISVALRSLGRAGNYSSTDEVSGRVLLRNYR